MGESIVFNPRVWWVDLSYISNLAGFYRCAVKWGHSFSVTGGEMKVAGQQASDAVTPRLSKNLCQMYAAVNAAASGSELFHGLYKSCIKIVVADILGKYGSTELRTPLKNRPGFWAPGLHISPHVHCLMDLKGSLHSHTISSTTLQTQPVKAKVWALEFMVGVTPRYSKLYLLQGWFWLCIFMGFLSCRVRFSFCLLQPQITCSYFHRL